MKRSWNKAVFAAALLFCISSVAIAEDLKPISLPAPRTEGGMPLMQALKERRSMRDYSPKELPLNILSDMLWAARGINRPETGRLTSPTAKNFQEIDVYVVRAEGAYLYDAAANKLVPAVAGDIRAATGSQPFVKDAPVNLVFVADLSKMSGMDPKSVDLYAATDAGYVSQNVYLYCASEGLATVVRGWVDRPLLAKAMKLGPDKRIILAQTVGYPKE